MTREEAILHYNDNYVKEALEKNRESFLENFQHHKQWLKEAILKATKEICDVVAKKQINSEYDIMYINFSLLRTSIISKEYNILVSAYNRNWYLDDYPTHSTLSLHPILSVIDDLRNYLEKKRKIYVNKIESFHVNEIILKQAFEYYTHMELFVTTVLQNIDEEQWLKGINKTEEFYIRWGEYRDLTHLVYKMDTRDKNQNDFEKAIKDQEDIYGSDKLIFSTWQHISLDNVQCLGKNFMFSNFKKCRFNNVEIIGTVLLGANFKQGILTNCDFSNTLLESANFNEAVFEKVSFKDAILKNADFTYAVFEEVDFENSNLEGARFLKKDIPFINLSPSQLQTIIIEEG